MQTQTLIDVTETVIGQYDRSSVSTSPWIVKLENGEIVLSDPRAMSGTVEIRLSAEDLRTVLESA